MSIIRKNEFMKCEGCGEHADLFEANNKCIICTRLDNLEKNNEGQCEHHYDDNDVCEFCGDMEKCPSDDCTCDYCTDDRQEIASLPEIKETLEEMFINQFKGCYIRNSEEDIATLYKHNLKYLAKIAINYYKDNKIEILGDDFFGQSLKIIKNSPTQYGMVSIKEVKKILFQDSKSLFSYDKWWFDRDSVREAIEKLEE